MKETDVLKNTRTYPASAETDVVNTFKYSIIVISSVCYYILFFMIYANTKVTVAMMLGIVPVSISAFFWGKHLGMGIGIIQGVATSVIVYRIHCPALISSTVFELIAGITGYMVIGLIIGVFSETNKRLKQEISTRKNIELQLEEYKKHLEEKVKTRTAELEKINEQLYQSQKMEAIGQLAGGIAHDFNNILAGIMGYTDLVKRKFGDNNQLLCKYIDIIIDNSKKAAELTTKLLAFARKGKYQVEPLYLHTIINDVVKLLEHTIDKKVKIEKQFCSNIPAVVGDKTQLQNAVLNLALNACDAMQDGGILTLKIDVITLNRASEKRTHDLPSGKYVVCSVIDTGVGIAQDIKERIFEPFFTTKKIGRGSGLGLASTYGIIKNHYGEIEVQSEPSKGSTFKIYLPVNMKREKVITDTTTRIVLRYGFILLVDDECVIRDVGSQMLRELGYAVFACKDGHETISYYQQHIDNIDLVLLDVMMPYMSGFECFTKLKEINPTIKVVITTGLNMGAEVKAILDHGAAGIIHKPFDIKSLLKVLDETLDR